MFFFLQELDVRNNPELEMPQKPVPDELGSGPEFYNVDFSLQTQLRMATGAPPPPLGKYSKLCQINSLVFGPVHCKQENNNCIVYGQIS